MNGVVTGGWSFVWSAYIATAVLLASYGIRTILQFLHNRALTEHK